MSVSIIPCPSCQAPLLSDTVQCPNCEHVLRPEVFQDATEYRLHSGMEQSADTVVCPDCRERVRKELVRCWQCGAFLRPEIAETYQKKLDLPSTPEPSQPDGPAVAVPSPEETIPLLAASVGSTEASLEQTAGEETEAAQADQTRRRQLEEAENQQAHSVATGGDVLLNIALSEEKEAERKRQTRGTKRPGKKGEGRGGFIIFCPNGHQIEVQDRHRGMSGRCPRCKAVFHVPAADSQEQKTGAAEAPGSGTTSDKAAPAGTGKETAKQAGGFDLWMTDVAIHRVDPKKLKLKPGSLQSSFEAADVGFSKQGITLVTLIKSGGLLGSSDKKRPAAREEMLKGLAEGKSLADLSIAGHKSFAADSISQIAVVQPAAYAHESMFAGIPVFGEGRIAVRLPKSEDADELLFASFALSEFRQFAEQLKTLLGIQDLGEDCGVPLKDTVKEYKCHYTDQPVMALENVAFYQADPALPLTITGRRCQECGLVVSEDARKKEKIGGKTGSGIAKAQCPKCKKRFGDITLYALAQAPPSSEPKAG